MLIATYKLHFYFKTKLILFRYHKDTTPAELCSCHL